MLQKYRRSILVALFFFCLILLVIPFSRHSLLHFFLRTSAIAPRYTVLIDAGHGGYDPGKVGIDGSLEKDINLAIALKLKKILTQNDVQVIMTRETDIALYNESDPNKKRSDLKNRRDQAVSCKPDAAISIHQNSFPSEKQKGAQVFYYVQSEESKILAEDIQNELLRMDPTNQRTYKSNDSYYLLKGNSCPMVIVECGFLSNWEETAKLKSEEYQEELAWAIHLGVMHFLNETNTP